MSNFNKPKFSLPGGAPPPPLTPPPAAGIPAEFADLIGRFPLPWCVGPNGYIWVAADVVKITNPDDRRVGDTSDGWRATGNVCRLVVEDAMQPGVAALIVHAVNKLGKA